MKIFKQIDYLLFLLKSSKIYRSRILMISEGIKGNQFAPTHSLLKVKLENDPLENMLKTRGGYRTSVTSKTEFFESIVDCSSR